MLSDPVLAVASVVRALEGLHVPYQVGGSLASSIYGIPRATQDVDLVAQLRREHVAPLVAALGTEFYADAEMIVDAIQHRSSFNVIHLPTNYKVDIFLLQPGAWGREEMARRRAEQIGEGDDTVTLYFSSPEDTILHKLEWFRAGGGVSDRQWGDVLGVLKVQGNGLDFAYLRRWAAELGLTELLSRALIDAGQDHEPTGTGSATDSDAP
jgi:hypothetical protein